MTVSFPDTRAIDIWPPLPPAGKGWGEGRCVKALPLYVNIITC
jgi:hypothetical protein